MNVGSQGTIWQKLLREPLLQFVLIGAAIFLLSDMVSESGEGAAQLTITVGSGDAERLSQLWQRMRMRPPSEEEYRDLIDRHIRDEVMYREALAMGLDKDDMVVRHRLKEKLEFLTESLMTSEPDEATLQAYLEENGERYRDPDRISFAQVYFSAANGQTSAEADARQALQDLESVPFNDRQALEAFGDPIELDSTFENATLAQVRKRFGVRFADALWQQAPGQWSGPLHSGFGLHDVYVSEVLAGDVPALNEVRGEVLLDYRERERQNSIDAVYERLKARYQIVIDEDVWQQPRRSSSSDEVAVQ